MYKYLSAAIRSLRFLHTFWRVYKMNIKFQTNAQKANDPQTAILISSSWINYCTTKSIDINLLYKKQTIRNFLNI